MAGKRRTQYGSACLNCVKVKSKCTPMAQGTSCERCHRLEKPCVPSVTARQLSRPSTQSPAVVNDNEVHVAFDDTSRAASSASHDRDEHNGWMGETNGSSSFLPCPGEPSEAKAEEYFASFRTEMLRFFPVFMLRPETTSQQLRAEKPFLWLCVMCVACPSMSQQLKLGRSIREIVARKMVCNGGKNLDLLLGLLTFLAWAHYQIRYMTFVTDLTQLAIGIVFDMGLNKGAAESRGPITFRAATRGKDVSERPTTPARGMKTMEERRAVLGCYLLSSTFACALKRMDGLRWTPDMDESLSILAERPEWDGDTLLSLQVRLQLLQAEIQQLGASQCSWPFGNGVHDARADKVLHPALLKGFQAKLEEVESQIPVHIASHDVIICHIHSAHLVLNEAFLNSSKPKSAHLPDLERIDRYEACMRAIKAWFDTLFSMPVSSYVGFTFTFMCHLAHGLLVLVRFSTVDDPAWDRATARSSIDVLSICDRLVENYGRVAQARLSASDGSKDRSKGADFFSDAASIFRFMRSEWEKQLDAANHVLPDIDMEETQRLIEEFLQPDLAAGWAEPPFLMDALWQ